MTRTSSHRNHPTKPQPINDHDPDVYQFDDEFDDFLDRYLADFRESPADFRNF